MPPEAVTARLREMSRLSDLSPDKRLAAKVDMSSEAVSRRLRLQSRLRETCLKWQRVGEANGLGPMRASPSEGKPR